MIEENTKYNEMLKKIDKCRNDNVYLLENVEQIKKEVDSEIVRLKKLDESGVYYWYIGTYTNVLGELNKIYSIKKKGIALEKHPQLRYLGNPDLFEIKGEDFDKYEKNRIKKSIEATNYYSKATKLLEGCNEELETAAYESCTLDRLTIIGEYSPILSLLENITLSQALARDEIFLSLEARIQLDYKYFGVHKDYFKFVNAGSTKIKIIFGSILDMRFLRMINNIAKIGNYSLNAQERWITWINELKISREISRENISDFPYDFDPFILYCQEDEIIKNLSNLNDLFHKNSLVLKDFEEKQLIFRKDPYIYFFNDDSDLIINDEQLSIYSYKKIDVIIALYNYIDKISYLIFQKVNINIPEHEWTRKKLFEVGLLLKDEPRYRYVMYLYNYIDENKNSGKFVIDELDIIKKMRNEYTHKWIENQNEQGEYDLDLLLAKVKNITLALLLTFFTAEELDYSDE